MSQKRNPVKGDFYSLVQEDFQKIQLFLSENEILNMSRNIFKNRVKKYVLAAAFKQYLTIKQSKSKVKNIQYDELKIQPYLSSNLFSNEECYLLFNLRSRMIDVKNNFKSKFSENMNCRMNCSEEENISHFMSCPVLLRELSLNEKKNIFK